MCWWSPGELEANLAGNHATYVNGIYQLFGMIFSNTHPLLNLSIDRLLCCRFVGVYRSRFSNNFDNFFCITTDKGP